MSAADSGATGLHFLVSTGVEKPDPALRKFIRSQVMIGKNRGKTRPVRKDRRKAIQEVPYQNPNQSPFEAWVHSNGDESLITPPKSSSTTPDLLLPLTVPRKFGSDMATMRFPDAVEPSTVDVFLKFSSIAKKILFPLESCVLFERKAEMWIAPLTFDAAFLHTMISMSHSYFDFVAGGRSSVLTKTTLHHFIKALKLLRERMSRDNDPITLSDSTTAAVMAFAGHALMMGDFNSAMNHMKGIHKIVGMRGGTSAFRSNPKLLTDILRCDIGIVLEHGSRPVFFRNTVHEDIPPYPDLTDLLELQERDRRTTYSRSPPTFLNDVDINLSQAWTALAAFCSVTNFAIQSRQLISMETCLNTMTSVMYRLLSMRFESGSSDEAVRLSLLAFSSSIFLQWKPLGLPYSYFTSEFRECLMRLPSPHPSPRLLLWLVMVGAVSVFETSDDAWLRPLLVLNMDCCGIKSWDQMRDLLDSFMWIGLVHDKAARRKFDSTVACMNIQSP